MRATLVPGYDGGVAIGQRKAYAFSAAGPSAYNPSTGDAFVAPFGVNIDAIMSAMTVSKTYYVRFYPSAVNTTRAAWVAKWYVISTGAEAGSIDLSAEKIQSVFLGGEF